VSERKTVDLDGPVAYTDHGGSGPTLVLVHGLGGSSVNWLAVAPALAQRARVLAIDLVGFGFTPPVGRSSSVDANRLILDRFLDSVVGAPAILAGNSMGGLISLLEAAAHPEKIAGLVLVDPAQPRAPGEWIDPAVAASFLMYSIPGVGEWYLRSRAKKLGPEKLVHDLLALCCVDMKRIPADVLKAHVDFAAHRMEAMPWGNAAFLEASRSLVSILMQPKAYREAVAKIVAPTLLIQGVEDRLVSIAASRLLAASRPEWSFDPIDGIGHTPMLEAPERFLASVNGWLEARNLFTRPTA
jgi:glycerol-3-phosphate dehydrogenase